MEPPFHFGITSSKFFDEKRGELEKRFGSELSEKSKGERPFLGVHIKHCIEVLEHLAKNFQADDIIRKIGSPTIRSRTK
jgi:hypothetical protein